MKTPVLLLLFSLSLNILAESTYDIIPFGENGKFKMLYDRRSGQQALQKGDKIYIVYNGNSERSEKGVKNDKAKPLFISYDLKKGTFSSAVPLGKADSDHHFSPVLWMDNNERLHVYHGCHKTPGTHLLSKDNKASAWLKTAALSESVSYPTVYNIANGKQLMYFRHSGHRGAWTYRISADEGKSWQGPKNFVTDMNMGDDLTDKAPEEMDEMSSYQSTALSKDGKTLHVVFSHYDDNKSGIPEKFYNPRYGSKKNLGIKFNLYYVKINLENEQVSNFAGETLKTPIDLKAANEHCKIWDTDHRGAGIPAQVYLDENDRPSFLHVLTEDSPEECNYYYVSFENGKWRQTLICKSGHEWNCACMYKEDGVLNAYLLTGARLNSFMDKHGGGKIEKWTSSDQGRSWVKKHDVFSKESPYANWRFNNIKPLVDARGNVRKGMFIFYGWNENKSTAKAFLMIDKSITTLPENN